MRRLCGAFKLPELTLLRYYGIASLFSFLVLGLVIAFFLGQSVESSALADARQAASDNLHRRLSTALTPQMLRTPLTSVQYRTFQRYVTNRVLSDRTVRIKVWNRHGRVIFSDDRHLQNRTFAPSDELKQALGGKLASDVSTLKLSENVDERRFGKLLEVYLPIQFTARGPVLGAFEIYQRYAPVEQHIATLKKTVYSSLGGGLLFLYVLLFSVVRRASNTIIGQKTQLERQTEEIETSYNHTIAALAAAVDARDSSTEQHSQRVAELAVALGRWIGLSDDEIRDLERGALLHDVGKIGVSDLILLKPGKLTDIEWIAMRRHPEIGYQMLRHISFLEHALPLVRYHHERWDGTGYPARLRAEEIPLHARLFAAIDTYDALTSDRPYRTAMSHVEAMEQIYSESRSHLDPTMVAAFDALMSRREDTLHNRTNVARLAIKARESA